MSVQFVKASSEGLYTDNAAFTAAPATMSAWFLPDTTTEIMEIVFVGDKDSANNDRFAMQCTSSPDKLRFQVRTGSSTNAVTSNTLTDGSWHHGCACEIASNDHQVYLDGDTANKGTSTTSRVPSGVNRTAIGFEGHSTQDEFFDGRICEVAIWDVAISEVEVVALSNRAHPFSIRPQSLVFYSAMYRDEDRDIIGNRALTSVGTPDIGVHYAIVPPPPKSMFAFAAAAAGGGNAMPMAMHGYRRRRVA